MRHGKDKIAGSYAAGTQRKINRIRPAGDADRMRNADKLCKFSLERLDLSAEDIGSAIEHAGNGGIDRGSKRLDPGARIGLWNRRGVVL